MDENQENIINPNSNDNHTPNLEELIDSGLGKINPEHKKEELTELENEKNNLATENIDDDLAKGLEAATKKIENEQKEANKAKIEDEDTSAIQDKNGVIQPEKEEYNDPRPPRKDTTIDMTADSATFPPALADTTLERRYLGLILN